MKQLLSSGLATLLLCAAASQASAQVRAMNLDEMVESSDQAVYGLITSKTVSRAISEDGRVRYYTTMTIQGRRMHDSTPIDVQVSYPGGFISEDEGYWHSESPSDAETKVGTNVVVFYKWFSAMNNAHTTNWLYANHGGVYRTVEGPSGPMVLGRGQGYAVSKNLRVADLESSIGQIRREQAQQRKNR